MNEVLVMEITPKPGKKGGWRLFKFIGHIVFPILIRRQGLRKYAKVFWGKDHVRIALDLTGVERDMPSNSTQEEVEAAAKRRVGLQQNEVVNIKYDVISTEEGGVRS
jgi:hypothetical protein